MLSSQTLRAIRPDRSAPVAAREQRLDEVVHLLEIRGVVDGTGVTEVSRRLDAALADGVRWCMLDLSHVPHVADAMLPALVTAARELRARRGELIVAGAEPTVGERLAAYDVPDRPALAANVQQAMMILKMLRPKTFKSPAPRRPRSTSLSLPRIEPIT